MSAPRTAPSRAGIVFKGLLCVLLAGVLGLIAWGFLYGGFSALRDMRHLERTPRSLAASVLPGEVTLLGRAAALETPLTAPDSGVETLYYHYLVEREERDNDGKTRWKTVENRTVYQPFLLVDESGEVKIDPSDRTRFDMEERHTRRDGDLRYSEHRLDPGDEVFVFGFADTATRPARIEFDTAGQYSPMISIEGERAAHGGMAGASLVLLWIGLCVLSFALYALLWGLRVHVSTVYLATLSLAMSGALLVLSVQAAQDDLEASFARTARDIAAAEAEIGNRLQERGVEWDGDWNTVGEAAMPGFDALPAEEQQILAHLRARLALQVERTAAVRRQWPERLVAGSMSLPVLPTLTPPKDFPSDAIPDDDGTGSLFALVIATIALGFATLFAWLAFRRIKLKRTIENLATTHTAGAAYGLVELQGVAALDEGSEPLVGPLSGQPCVWFHYVVKERRGVGKNAKWVTIEDRRVDRRFLLVDDEGSLPIEPAQADAIVRCSRSRREGSFRYSEQWIEPGTPLYALGSALVDPRTDSSLLMCRGPKEQPFLLTDLSESELMLRKARSGFLFLNLGTNAGNAAALALLGASATLDGAGFVAAALVPLLFFAIFLGIVMYNDLVMLRQRVRRAWSNIQVSLMKRADLVPQLQSVLQAYLDHEAGLQANLARLRTLSQQVNLDPQAAGQLVDAEQGVMARLVGLREENPELDASEPARQLADALVRLENEVALMRAGYNDAVERYNTRCQKLPELIFAKAFRFLPETPFQASMEVHAVPMLALAPA